MTGNSDVPAKTNASYAGCGETGGMVGMVTDGAAPAETACRSHSAGELASLVVTTISSWASGAPTLPSERVQRNTMCT